AAPRTAPDLQGARQQDPLRLRPQGPAPRGARMGRRTQEAQAAAPGDPPAQPGPGADPRPAPPPPGGAAGSAGRALVQTTRPFFPQLNAWLDRLPDTRVPEACTYSTRFLAWSGLALYL